MSPPPASQPDRLRHHVPAKGNVNYALLALQQLTQEGRWRETACRCEGNSALLALPKRCCKYVLVACEGACSSLLSAQCRFGPTAGAPVLQLHAALIKAGTLRLGHLVSFPGITSTCSYSSPSCMHA